MEYDGDYNRLAYNHRHWCYDWCLTKGHIMKALAQALLLTIIILLSILIGMILGMNLQEPKECGYEQHKERLESITGSKLSLYVKG